MMDSAGCCVEEPYRPGLIAEQEKSVLWEWVTAAENWPSVEVLDVVVVVVVVVGVGVILVVRLADLFCNVFQSRRSIEERVSENLKRWFWFWLVK